MFEFTVPGDPQGKARPRLCRSGHVFTPQKSLEYEKKVKDAFVQSGGMMLDGYISIEIVAFYIIPTKVSRITKEKMRVGELRPAKKPDSDNVAKSICDALNGFAYRDDSSVTTLIIRKFYADIPRVTIRISHDNEINTEYVKSL